MFKKFLSAGLAAAVGLSLVLPLYADVVSMNAQDMSGGGGGGGIEFGGATGGTATRVLFTDGSGNLADNADLTFVTDTLTATKIGSTTFTGTNLSTGRHTFGTAADAVGALDLGETAGQITWEGAVADTSEARLAHTVNAGFDTLTTIPATGASQTVAVLENAQTFSGVKTYSAAGPAIIVNTNSYIGLGTAGATTDAVLMLNTTNTPDATLLAPGNTSNSIVIYERADGASDAANGSCGTSACTHPSVVIKSTTASDQTAYRTIAYFGTAGRANKTLTESSGTAVIRIPVASGAGTGGTLDFTVFASDATDHQTLTGTLYFSAVNKAGTETCPDPTVVGTALNAVSTGTLTCTYACDETPTNAVDLTFNCTSSLTQSTLDAYTQVTLVGPGLPAPQ